MSVWTIKKLLDWITDYFETRSIDSARLSAELLLSHILDLKRIELYVHFDRVVTPDNLSSLHKLVKRAGDHEPVSYIVGRAEFYSFSLSVCSDCLIPRPETELLVERAVEFLRSRDSNSDSDSHRTVLDLCTGSGCVAIAIAKNFDNCDIIATDINQEALSIADQNIATYNLSGQIKTLGSDMFAELDDLEKFDLIVSNPPYISTVDFEQLDKNVKAYEPSDALLAGVDGLDFYRIIANESAAHLKSDGVLMLEIGHNQASDVTSLLNSSGFGTIKVDKDFAKNDRVIIASMQPF